MHTIQTQAAIDMVSTRPGIRRLALAPACGVTAVVVLGALLLLLQQGAGEGGGSGPAFLRRALQQQQQQDGADDDAGGTPPPAGALLLSIAGQGDGDHKPFYPLNQADVLTIVVAALGLIVAAGGGIGGGGILVPLYILVLGFAPKRAIPLSNVTIFGGAIANVIAGLRNRHPFADRPLMDFTLILMMEPTTIVGAVVGSFANKVLPELVVSVLLVLVLAALAHRTLKKGLRQLEKEGGVASLCAVGDKWARRHARIKRRESSLLLRPEGSPSSSTASVAHEDEKVEEVLLSVARTANGPPGLPGAAAVATVATETTGLLGDKEPLRRPKLGSYSSLPSSKPRNGLNTLGSGGPLTRAKSYHSGQFFDENDDEDDQEDVPPEILSTRSPSMLRPGPRARRVLFPSSPRSERGGLAAAAQGEEGQPAMSAEAARREEEMTPGLVAILEKERRIPLWQPATLTLCFIGILVLNVLKGGKGAPSPLGFECGSLGYWLVTLSALPWVAVFFVVIRRRVLAAHEAKVRAGYEFLPGDLHWTPSSTIKFPLICMLAGLFAGIFGVGGGIVKGPLMLEMGVLPPVAAASAACMILYTSAAASAAYFVFGLIPMDYGLFFFCSGFCCTAIGQAAVTLMLRKYKRESFIVLSIGFVILLSACLMGFQAVADFAADPKGASAFGSLCGER